MAAAPRAMPAAMRLRRRALGRNPRCRGIGLTTHGWSPSGRGVSGGVATVDTAPAWRCVTWSVPSGSSGETTSSTEKIAPPSSPGPNATVRRRCDEAGKRCGSRPDGQRSQPEDRVDDADCRAGDDGQFDVAEPHGSGSDEVGHEQWSGHPEGAEQQRGGGDPEVGQQELDCQGGEPDDRGSADESVRESTVDQVDQRRGEQRNQHHAGGERDTIIECRQQGDGRGDHGRTTAAGLLRRITARQRPLRAGRRRCRTTSRLDCHHDRHDSRPVGDRHDPTGYR